MKERIQFIDLAKGVCILMVVISHCGILYTPPGCQSLRMPLYFILSGLFFKDYGGILEFAIKKTNKILIPFVFFYCIGYVCFYTIKIISPNINIGTATGILDVFTQRQYFNGPIWFLLALFWANLMYMYLYTYIRKEWLRTTIIAFLAFIGIKLGNNNIFLPCMIDVAMTSLPFFYIGHLLKQTSILYPNKFDRLSIPFAVFLWCIAFMIEKTFGNPHVSFHYNIIYGNYIVILIASICSVMAVLFLCKSIVHLPFVSFCGRYSIIMLCLHHLVNRPLLIITQKLGFSHEEYIVAILTILICWALIPVCIRYLPYVTAQKDIIKR